MARQTNAAITYDDANYMIDNEGFSRIGGTITGLRCLTKAMLTAYMEVDPIPISGYASSQLVPYQLIQSSGINLPANAVILVSQNGNSPDNGIYYYDTVNKELIKLSSLDLAYVTGVARTATKMWLTAFNNEDNLLEYDITLVPFTMTFNRVITGLPSVYGYTAVDNNTLISFGGSSGTEHDIYVNDITNDVAVPTLFSKTIGQYGPKRGIYTTTNKLIVLTDDGRPEVWQFDYATGALEFTTDPNQFEFETNLYIQAGELFMTSGHYDPARKIHNIDFSTPYGITVTDILSIPITGAAQDPTYSVGEFIFNSQTIYPTSLGYSTQASAACAATPVVYDVKGGPFLGGDVTDIFNAGTTTRATTGFYSINGVFRYWNSSIGTLGNIIECVSQVCYNVTVGFGAFDAQTACSRYGQDATLMNSLSWQDATKLATDGSCINAAPTGYYSNGTEWLYWSGTAITSRGFC